MDFHSLKRRDLQALCKRNKIPANITNVAMADALTALDVVQGIEEFLNPSSVESPEKTVKASPCVPRTGGRTTTSRKSIKEEAASVQISTRARRGTRKATAEEGTPGNQKEEVSVQKMYSRRSTRLLEKKMMELNLNNEERIEPIDFGGSDKEMANEMEGNVKKHSDDLGGVLEDQGLNQETISDDLPMKNDDLEDLLDKKSDDLSENGRELEQPSKVLDESDIVLVSEEHTVGLTPEMGEDVDDEVSDASKDQKEDDDGVGSEGYADSDILSGENLDKSRELKDEVTEKEGSDDSGYIATAECLVSENAERVFNAEKDLGSKDSADIVEPVNDVVSEDSGQMELGTLTLSVCAAAEDQKQHIELQNQVQGMGEFLNPSSVESPEKTVKASPCVPRTGGRTTTRRKPINEEAESVQISTRARRGTRRAIAEEEENAKIDVALSLRKMETPGNQKEEVSVQKMYSRRSTRLSEKKMMELNLNDDEGMEPIDFGSDEEMADEMKVSGKEDSDDFGRVSDIQGLNQETKTDDFSKNGDLEDLMVEKSDDLSENARELEQPFEVLDESGIVLVSEENTFKFTPEGGEDDAIKDDGLGSESCAESDLLSGENLEKSLELEDEAPEKEAECLVPEEGEQGFNAEKDLGLKDSDDIMDPVDDLVSGGSGQVEFDTLNLRVSVAAEDQKQDIELQNQAIIESDVMMFAKDPEDEFDHAEYSFGSNQLRNEEVTQVTPKGGEESDQLVIFEATAIELSNANDCPPVTDSQMSSCSVICESDVSDQVTPQDVANIGNLMAVNPSTFSFPSDKSSSDELPVDMPFSTLAVDPLPEQMSSSLLQSNSDRAVCPASVTPRKKSSSKTPTTSRKISILLDENKENIDNNGRNLDLTKEKGKKEDSLNDKSLRQLNKMLKENIDNSERKLDLIKEKGKKEDSLNDKSMRQLTKMLKEKLQITSRKNIHEEKDIAKVGRARPALQSLSENRLAASEPGNEI
ncbi:uncharacterized protein LOC131319937 isoform X2 [Rhododendron vialii]|uniref:uncharacterized protein LOC131319937 isoform X2 n=1 Tax=Rhododendron vialii TaxID=182163 RepID=UPI00265E414B|nr:uncharacterized protein LOC131319937 isoform X2 [Rhododendron vialii]